MRFGALLSFFCFAWFAVSAQAVRSLESMPAKMTAPVSDEWRASIAGVLRNLGGENVDAVLDASKMVTVLRDKELLAVVRLEGKRFCPRDDGLCLTIIEGKNDKAVELMFYAGDVLKSLDTGPQFGGAHFRPLAFYGHDLTVVVFNSAMGLIVAPLRYTLPP